MSDRKRIPSKHSRNFDRFEQDLMRAKNAQKKVAFDLAVPTRHSDSEGTVEGFVCQIDKYSVEIEVAGKNSRVWIAKSMIVMVEVL